MTPICGIGNLTILSVLVERPFQKELVGRRQSHQKFQTTQSILTVDVSYCTVLESFLLS